jgi:hypothetical protein
MGNNQVEKFWVFHLAKYVRMMYGAYADVSEKARKRIKDVRPIIKKTKIAADEAQNSIDDNAKLLYNLIETKFADSELNSDTKKEILRTVLEEMKTFVIQNGGPNEDFLSAYNKFQDYVYAQFGFKINLLAQIKIEQQRIKEEQKRQDMIIEKNSTVRGMVDGIKIGEDDALAGSNDAKVGEMRERKEEREKFKKIQELKQKEDERLHRVHHLKSGDFWNFASEESPKKRTDVKKKTNSTPVEYMELHHLKKPAMQMQHHEKEDADVTLFHDNAKEGVFDERRKTVILLCSFVIVLVMLLIILMKVFS